MQIEKFVNAIISSIDTNEIEEILTDEQKAVIVSSFFAKSESREIISLLTEQQRQEIQEIIGEDESEDKSVDLSTVETSDLFDYVTDHHMRDYLHTLDCEDIVEYVVENYPRDCVKCLGIDFNIVDSLRDLLDVIDL